MEKENKRKAIPNINEEQMMNLMADGIKKEGLQLHEEQTDQPIKPDSEDVKELPKEKPPD